MRIHRWWSWCLASTLALTPALGHAQDVTAAEHDAAVTNFQAGRRFVEQNDCKNAIPRFIESLKHEQNVGARFNLAECSRKEGREVEAWNQYKIAEQLAIQKNDDRRNDARKAINELEPKVLKLRLVLPQGVSELSVKIDGQLVERTDFPLLETGYAVAPNQPHTLEVTATNRSAWNRADVKGAAGGELPAMTVDLGQPLVAEGVDPNTGNKQRVTGLIVAGVGLVGVAVGAVAGVITLSKRSAYQDEQVKVCGPSKQCPFPEGDSQGSTITDKKSAFESAAAVSTVAFIAGGVLVATGAVIYFTAPKAPSTSAARLHLVPSFGPGSAGATLGGAF